MNREIKFRVYDSISKQYHYWDVIKSIGLNGFNLEHYTLEQFTGLKDINGLDIYENDIIEYHTSNQLLDNSKRKVVELVKWMNVGWNLNIYCTYNILGNIHENTE